MRKSGQTPAGEPLFDAYSDNYQQVIGDAISFGGQEHAFYLQFKARLIMDILRDSFPDPSSLSVLDFGCGTGGISRFLAPELPRLDGTDISAASLDQARAFIPGVRFTHAPETALPFADASFDAVFAVCVFHHIDPAARARSVAEINRILKPDGLVIIMEHNPWNPGTRLVVNRCELDRDAVLLSRGETKRLLTGASGLVLHAAGYFLVFPWDNAFTRACERILRRLPVGAQYFVAARKAALPSGAA
jgi:SAM-dependent methyltransferase